MWRYVLLVCTLAAWSPGGVSQMITQQPMSTAPQLVGETASFSCEAESFPVSNITWFRVESGPTDVELMDNGVDITITSEVAGNTTSSSLSVLVQGAEDFTQYLCVAGNGFDNVTSDRVDLVQAVLQSVAVSPQTQDVNIDEVPSITLSCTVTTDRPVDTTIEWTSNVRSGVLATGTGTSLDLDQNTADLAVGEQFTCTAALGTGSMSDTAVVNIYTPITELEPPTDTDPLLVGEIAMFTTTVMSVPAPEVTWMRQIIPVFPQLVPLVPDGDSINVTLQNLSSTTYISVLFLRVPEILPGAVIERYFALFENSFTTLGNSNDAGLLIRAVLNSVTVSPASSTINIDQQASITLSCVVDANRDATIEWTSNIRTGVMLASGTGLSLDLTQITADLAHQEELTCSATLGTTIVSDTAAVTTFSFVSITQQPMSTAPLLVGETASFSCEAESRPAPSITWFRVESGSALMLVDDGMNIRITSEVADNTTTSSSLSVLVQGAEDFTQYFCVADNGFDNETSATVDLIQAVAPSFLEEPADVTLIAGEVASLNCTATGPPLPSITWEDGGGNSVTDDDVFNITVEDDGVTVSSFLEFVPNVTEAGYRCVAENRVNRTESRLAIVIIAGPPGSPAPVNAGGIGPRGANVSWTLPPSLLPITEYQITILLNETNSQVFNRTLQSGDEGFEERLLVVVDLRPVTGYVAEVAAVNRAGVGNNASVTFTTLEDVPEAPPTNVTTSARIARQILVEWSPPPMDEQNGVITQYTVQFQNSSEVMQTNTTTAVTSFNLTNLAPGVTYNISVAAHTMVGPGPFSDVVQQPTLSEPPEFPPGPIPEPPRGNISTSTFTFGISVPPRGFNHFWVIIVRLAATTSPDQFPMLLNNDSFVNFTTFDPVPVDRPYIAAEISAGSLPSSFSAGDSASTAVINDIDIYVNGPLLEGARYTAFIWGFVPAVPGSQDARRRRQTTPLPIPRQYSSFSSSSFVTPIFTATDSGLSPGAVAGIVIGIVLAMVLVGAIVILLLLVFGLKKKPDWGAPPSRKGSVRLRDFRDTAPKIKAETELQDLNPDDVRLPVSVEDFEGHVKKMHANTDHLFSEEYEIIQIKSPSLPHIQCSMPFNVNKNRYANINCYDESRVHLTKIFGVDGSDYINANYIHGFQQKQAYIATQGPLPNTTHDFWRMVWEFRTCCIIMLTNLVEKSRAKCHQYWPEAGSVSFGELTVTIIDTQELAYYSIRTFRMNRGNDRREVKQFHYTGWPDFGVPDHPHPVISFIRRISNFKRTHDGPDIIHCSAGVGRTGTLITIQAMLAMLSEEGKVDIFNFVLGMRTLRNYMVQTERQYIFIHDAVMELLHMGETEVPIQSLRRRFKELQAQDPESELSGLEKEYLHIKELSVVDKSQFSSAKMTVNLGKNRFPDIFPYDDYRVRLLMHPGVSGSDYINASYVDGYQQRQQYIVTQGPMKHTVDDFWRMIWEHRVCAILMMCQLEEKGKEQCVRYWPSDKIRQHGDLFVELTQEQEFSSYTMREFSVTNTKLNESRVVKHYQFVDWSEDSAPANAAGIIDLIGVLQKTQHMSGGGPIVAHDSIPTGRAGTFCVLSNILEQLKVEGIVDLFFAVHCLRQQQPGIVHTIDEYKFCYTAVLEFLDSFDHYANFD